MRRNPHNAYLFGAVVVWAGTFLAAAVVLDSEAFADMLPILIPAASWSVVITPLLFRDKASSEEDTDIDER